MAEHHYGRVDIVSVVLVVSPGADEESVSVGDFGDGVGGGKDGEVAAVEPVELEVGISDGAVAHVGEEIKSAVAVVGKESYPVDVGEEVANELYVFVDIVFEEAASDDVVERVDVNYVVAIEHPVGGGSVGLRDFDVVARASTAEDRDVGDVGDVGAQVCGEGFLTEEDEDVGFLVLLAAVGEDVVHLLVPLWGVGEILDSH